MVSGLEELAFQEAVRATTQQQTVLEALRTRTVGVAGAAAVTTGLFSESALEAPDLDVWSAAAFAVLSLIGVLAGVVLWPRRWEFSNNVTALAEESASVRPEDRDDEFRSYLRDWAFHMQEVWTLQERRLDRLAKAYAAALVLLIVLTIIWAGRILL